jgi:DNA polymerase III alpha subunit (gram-positive type)
MRQTMVNYSNPLSYQYRCDQCQRAEFVSDKPDPVVVDNLEDFLRRRGLVKSDEHLTMEELRKRLDALGTRSR